MVVTLCESKCHTARDSQMPGVENKPQGEVTRIRQQLGLAVNHDRPKRQQPGGTFPWQGPGCSSAGTPSQSPKPAGEAQGRAEQPCGRQTWPAEGSGAGPMNMDSKTQRKSQGGDKEPRHGSMTTKDTWSLSSRAAKAFPNAIQAGTNKGSMAVHFPKYWRAVRCCRAQAW